MFCIVRGKEYLGKGKIVSQDNGHSIVEYFYSPSKETAEQVQTRSNEIIKIKLAPKTQVYYWSAGTDKWHICNVIEDYGNEILVESNGKSHKFKSYEYLFVRCNKSIVDASEYLANSITQPPQITEFRTAFLKEYTEQKNIAWGISALLSSVIELETHQIRVVRRVLADPSQRYLLADEVGLGKTIEAGVIIRQAVIDDPEGHRIVVLTPRSLMDQWKEELITRFGLEYYLDKSLFILPHEHSTNLQKKLDSANMLVIDEAHKISREGLEQESLYALLSRTCHRLKRLILLSATPIATNQVGFLRMLHLLDPVVYSLNDLAGFKRKVDIRLQLGEAIAGLDVENIFFINNSLNQLLQHLPEDEICSELITKLRLITQRGLPDASDPLLVEAIDNLKAHMSETYKLDRRILRNRRSRLQLTNLKKRSGGEVCRLNGQVLGKIEGIFESWRIDNSGLLNTAENNIYSEISTKIIRSIVEYNYEQLESDLKDFQFELSISQPAIFNNIKDFLENMITATKGAMQSDQGRLFLLASNTISLIRRLKKVVIFCSNKSSADKVYGHLQKLIPRAVIRHDRTNRPGWCDFGNSDLINVIVCDQYAEEGLNFQGGDEKVLIHFDLPFEPQRIEQRIGRLDRYGSTSNIKSIIIIDDSSLFQKSYYKYLSEGLGIFDASISEIQYLVEQNVNDFQQKLFTDGLDAIDDNTTLLVDQGVVINERKSVRYQDELNALSETIKYSNLIPNDDIYGLDFYTSFDDWVTNALEFESVVKQVDTHDYNGIKFRYKLDKQNYKNWSDRVFQQFEYALVDRDWDIPGSFQYTNNRKIALKSKSKQLRLLRYGDPLVEAVRALMKEEDRGRSSAIWRKIDIPKDSDEKNSIYFCFEFLVESNLSNAGNFLKNLSMFSVDAILSLERRANSLFPNILEQIWVDEEGDEVNIDLIMKYLNKPFNETTDVSLNTNQLKALEKEEMGKFSNWENRVYLMRDKAKEILLSRDSLIAVKQKAHKLAMDEDRLREAQLTIREHLLRDSEAVLEHLQRVREKSINEFLYNGFSNPKVNIESVRAVVISTHTYPPDIK